MSKMGCTEYDKDCEALNLSTPDVHSTKNYPRWMLLYFGVQIEIEALNTPRLLVTTHHSVVIHKLTVV